MGQTESSSRRSKQGYRVSRDVWETMSTSSVSTGEDHRSTSDDISLSPKSFNSNSHPHQPDTPASDIIFALTPDNSRSQCLRGHRSVVRCLAACEQYLFSGSWDKKIKVWSLKDYSLVKTVDAHAAPVTGLCICGNFLFSASEDKTIKKWDRQTGTELLTMKGHRDMVFFVIPIWDTLLVSGGADGTLRIWNARNGVCDGILQGHEASVLCAVVDCSDQRRTVIYTGSGDRTLRLWELERREPVDCWADGEPGGVNAIVLSGSYVFAASGCSVSQWAKQGVLLQRMQSHVDRVYCLAIVDGVLLSGCKDGTIKCWNTQTCKCTNQLCGPGSGVLCLTGVASGKRAASGTMDASVHLWTL